MREIKFRAWVDAANRMLGPFTPADFEDGMIRVEFDNDKGAIFIDESELLQYTGLKDKNGKEIYEGDIVEAEELKSPMTDDSLVVVEKYRNVVVYEHAGFVWADEDSEVIGNIYENPELLEKP